MNYNWVCHYCSTVCSKELDACSNCGFPANASVDDIERAKELGSVRAFLDEEKSETERIANLPIWRRSIEIILFVIIVIGFILGRFAPAPEHNFLGMAIIGISLVVFWGYSQWKK